MRPTAHSLAMFAPQLLERNLPSLSLYSSQADNQVSRNSFTIKNRNIFRPPPLHLNPTPSQLTTFKGRFCLKTAHPNIHQYPHPQQGGQQGRATITEQWQRDSNDRKKSKYHQQINNGLPKNKCHHAKGKKQAKAISC